MFRSLYTKYSFIYREWYLHIFHIILRDGSTVCIFYINEVISVNKEALERMALLIKEKRRVYGYTQEQIAEQLDISYSYYTKIENGIQAPSLEKLVRIASLLNLSLDKMIFGSSSEGRSFSPDAQELLHSINQFSREDIAQLLDLLGKISSYLG